MKSFLSFLLTLILFILSCSDATGPAGNSTISGTVVDQDGYPVENALLEISYYPDFIPDNGLDALYKTNSSMSVTLIKFALPQRDHVKFWITRFRSVDTISVLIDTVLAAGYHQVRFSGRDAKGILLKSDVYAYHIRTSGSSISRPMPLLIDNYSVLNDLSTMDFYAKTDNNGYFEIDQNQLACNFDTVFTATDGSGNNIGEFKISRYIKIWALHDSYQATYKDSIYADLIKGAEVKIQMSEK